MAFFEITAAGFDGSTSKTDNRVLWVLADFAQQVQEAIKGTGAAFTDLPLEPAPADIDYRLPADYIALHNQLLQLQATPPSTPLYRNRYICPCGCSWEDIWSCQCDDRCPDCNTSVTPHHSEEVKDV